MKGKTIYLAHPFTGDGKKNIEKAGSICRTILFRFRDIDLTIISPLHALSYLKEEDQEIPSVNAKIMNDCLRLLDKCEELWLSPGWEESKGCKQEVKYALTFDIPVYEIIFKDEGGFYTYGFKGIDGKTFEQRTACSRI